MNAPGSLHMPSWLRAGSGQKSALARRLPLTLCAGDYLVHKFSPQGELLLSWGRQGTGPGELRASDRRWFAGPAATPVPDRWARAVLPRARNTSAEHFGMRPPSTSRRRARPLVRLDVPLTVHCPAPRCPHCLSQTTVSRRDLPACTERCRCRARSSISDRRTDSGLCCQ